MKKTDELDLEGYEIRIVTNIPYLDYKALTRLDGGDYKAHITKAIKAYLELVTDKEIDENFKKMTD